MGPWCSGVDVAALPACADVDPDEVGDYITAATEALFVRSGRQFGTRTVTVRPCARPYSGTSLWDPSWGAAVTWGQGWCRCRQPSPTSCGCGAGPSEIRLGLGPILDVTMVKVDGVEVADADRSVQEATWLVYLADATGRPRYWPVYQRIDLPDTEVGTFSVTALVGVPVPTLGRLATAELACELTRLGTEECKLPANVAGLTREGVTFDVVGLSAALGDGHLGLAFVDLFVSTYNPKGLQRRARSLFPPPSVPRRVDTVGS